MMKTMQRRTDCGSLALNPVKRNVWEFNRVTHLPGRMNDIVRVNGVYSQTNRLHQSLGTELYILRTALRITIDMVCTIEGTQLIISSTQKRTETVFTIQQKDGTKSTVKRTKAVGTNSVTINRLDGVELDVSKFDIQGMMGEMEKVFHPDNLQTLLYASTVPVEHETVHHYYEHATPQASSNDDRRNRVVILPVSHANSELYPVLQVK